MRKLLFFAGLLILFAAEILRVYFIMPFPGSQQSDTINIAYWLGRNISWIRIIGLLLIISPLIYVFKYSRTWKKVLCIVVIGIYVYLFYMINFRFEADHMFYQPKNKSFATASSNEVDDNKLIIGVAINGEAKAYPIQVIGYHHQVRDTVGNTPVMVTYCTVCRTGRVYSPLINGKPETFRLVGMDHFNAMFEDATTKSWWQQATGIAITGALKGSRLNEISSQQMTLSSWLKQHPNSGILQPDTLFNKKYKELAKYDNGTVKDNLEKRDSASWQFKSWVIGVVHNDQAKAYDWNNLVANKYIQDSIAGLPLIITLENDTASFHVFNRSVDGNVLQFQINKDTGNFSDLNTQSTWNNNGYCIDGPMKGKQLQTAQAYQEFWHSWRTFHPQTLSDKL